MKNLRLSLMGLLSLVPIFFSPSASSAEPVTLDVKFKLVDWEYNPLPNVPVRVVLGCDPDWQKANSGHSFTTDDKGEGSFSTKAEFDKIWIKDPGDMVSNLIMPKQRRNRIWAGAELNFMGVPSVYLMELVAFPRGTTGQENFLLYARDEQGNFSKRTEPSDYYSLRPDLKNLVLVGPGWQPSNFGFDQSKEDPSHWTLELGFKRSEKPFPRTESLDSSAAVSQPDATKP